MAAYIHPRAQHLKQIITRAQLLLRWPRSVARVESDSEKMAVGQFSGLVRLSVMSLNTPESHILPETRDSGLHFCCIVTVGITSNNLT